MKNYYKILNVKQTATDDEIKRSYRVLAKKYHPDVNPGDASAAEKFADINEANGVLSDAKARAEYDVKLKESLAPKPSPEEVMARQRAQAQAAARQAAAQKNAAFAGAGTAHVHAQFRDAQIQAQVNAMRMQAMQAGYDQGCVDTRAAAEAEIKRITANLNAALAENKKLKAAADAEKELKKQLQDAERDRRELEQELFNRDRELSQERLHTKEIEEMLSQLRKDAGAGSKPRGGRSANNDEQTGKLRELAEQAQMRVRELEQEIKQSELKNQAQIQLQQDKRKQLQEEIDELTKTVESLTAENAELRAENEQWQQYANSEDFISDTERRLQDFDKKVKADKRLAKPTLYGTLGVLIWATDEEIEKAYTKLAKRYSGKNDEQSASKLDAVEKAYATLKDENSRAEYNKTIGIDAARIEEERRIIAEFESMEEEYRSRLATKEFWEWFDEINASALEGDATAQNTLGELYYYGDNIDQDFEQAVFWFKEAAKQKNADAMYNLGVCMMNGEGGDRNETTGLGFIRQAAKLGSDAAKKFMQDNK